jgi:hypothetical protein
MEYSPPVDQDTEASYCNWHPTVETRLSCSQCGKSMCTQCLVQAPVGIRCRECGRAEKMPTFDVRPSYYARAIGVGIGIAIGGGLLWGLFNFIFGGIPFVSSFAALAMGYGAGELVSASVNRKRGTGLAWIAGVSVVVAYLISVPANLGAWNPFGLILVGIAVYMAVSRVK